MNIILNKEKGSEIFTNKPTDSGYDVKCIGYARIKPIFENISGQDIVIDGKIQEAVWLQDDPNGYVILQPNEPILLKTGIKIELLDSYDEEEDYNMLLEIQCRPRSGMALKRGLHVHLGTVDNGYRGDIDIIATNVNKYPILIKYGERVGQLVINPIAKVGMDKIVVVDSFDKSTDRGAAGYGSSGN